MSYLAGPLTRDQIKALMATAKSQAPPADEARLASKSGVDSLVEVPVLPPSIKQYYVAAQGEGLVYFPRLLAAADIAFTNARYQVDDRREHTYAVEFDDGPVAVDWDNAETLALSVSDLETSGEPGASYADCPACATKDKNYVTWEKQLKRWVRQNESISLFRSSKHRLTSTPGESEGEFRARLQQVGSEKRDQAVAKLRKRYASKATTLDNRLLRAEQSIEREQQQSSQKKMDTAISVGTAILSAVLGRKRLSTTTAGRVGTAIRKAGGARKEAADVARAKQTAKKVRADLATLNDALAAEVEALESAYDAQTEELTEIPIRPKASDIHVLLIGLAWMPYRDGGDGRLKSACDA